MTNYTPKYLKLDITSDDNVLPYIRSIREQGLHYVSTSFDDVMSHVDGGGNKGGYSFNKILIHAISYFYDFIFVDPETGKSYDTGSKHRHTLKFIKGAFDCCNYTNYKPIVKENVEYNTLTNAPLFTECWFVIQSAYFFNSERFGGHQFLDYINYYVTTGKKLPIENYKHDREYLKLAYLRRDKKSNNESYQNKKEVEQEAIEHVKNWFYEVLLLMVDELNRSREYFRIKEKDNREYNALVSTPRELRKELPFKVYEYDIKSAYPSFIDMMIGSNLSNDIYENIKKNRNISRGRAKQLVQIFYNGRDKIKKTDAIDFFRDCGYSENDIKRLMKLVYDPDEKFFYKLTPYEEEYIGRFCKKNGIRNYTRLHDAVYKVYDGRMANKLDIGNHVLFGYKSNKIRFNDEFKIGNKWLNRGYIRSLPFTSSKVNYIVELTKTNEIGRTDNFIYYDRKYDFISSFFNIATIRDFKDFKDKIYQSFENYAYINRGLILDKHDISKMLNHIRHNSNLIFDIDYLVWICMNYEYSGSYEIKSRDFRVRKDVNFRTKKSFLKALNGGRGEINNLKNLNKLKKICSDMVKTGKKDYIKKTSIVFKGKRKSTEFCRKSIDKINEWNRGNFGRKEIDKKMLWVSPTAKKTRWIKRDIEKREKNIKELIKIQNTSKNVSRLYLFICMKLNHSNDLGVDIDVNPNLFTDMGKINKPSEGVYITAEPRKENKRYEISNDDLKKDFSGKPDISGGYFDNMSDLDIELLSDIGKKEWKEYNLLKELDTDSFYFYIYFRDKRITEDYILVDEYDMFGDNRVIKRIEKVVNKYMEKIINNEVLESDRKEMRLILDYYR